MTDNALPTDFAENPVPGVFDNVPNEDYHALPGWGSTLFKAFTRSPAHAIAARNKQPTPQQLKNYLIGRAQHTILLEPHKYASEFCILPHDLAKRNKNSNAYKDGLAEFIRSEADGREIVTADEETQLLNMRDAVWSHPVADQLLTGKHKRRECSIWTEQQVNGVGILRKCRPDLWLPGLPVDVKTTQDANPKAYGRIIHNFGYHVQGAWYIDTMAPHDPDVGEMFAHIAVEKEAPFGVSVVRIDPQAIALGRTIIENTLPRLAECIKADKWPGYSQEIQVVNVPAYAFTQAEFDAEGDD
jgi:exodeoxyribonuclease VIII